IAVVTGASSGIGKAIALALASHGVKLCLVGRKLETLEAIAEIAQNTTPRVLCYRTDLTVDEDIYELKAHLEQDFGKVDLLILSAGIYSMGTLQSSTVKTLDWLYQSNVRAPYLLTKALLPMLLTSRGQLVFMNSSSVKRTRADVGQFAATQHALKEIADSLREEVNADGVRVLSVFPGRTATPRQANIFEIEGREYHPEHLIQPEDVAAAVINALSLPQTAEVTDIHIRPFKKFN
ncbi:MAG: SDR family oxidoreductase, partial [Brasilonema sp.]